MSILNMITEYWYLILATIGFIVSYVEIKMQNADQEKRITSLERDTREMAPIWIEIKERLVAIETTLKILIK